jgi:hypothetical protein
MPDIFCDIRCRDSYMPWIRIPRGIIELAGLVEILAA